MSSDFSQSHTNHHPRLTKLQLGLQIIGALFVASLLPVYIFTKYLDQKLSIHPTRAEWVEDRDLALERATQRKSQQIDQRREWLRDVMKTRDMSMKRRLFELEERISTLEQQLAIAKREAAQIKE